MPSLYSTITDDLYPGPNMFDDAEILETYLHACIPSVTGQMFEEHFYVGMSREVATSQDIADEYIKGDEDAKARIRTKLLGLDPSMLSERRLHPPKRARRVVGRVGVRTGLTATDAEHIRKLLTEGKSHAEVAARYGVCSSTIGRIHTGQWSAVDPRKETGRIRMKLKAEDAEQIRTLLKEGKSHAAIAIRYGVGPSTISRIHTGQWNAVDPRTKITGRRLAELREDFAKGREYLRLAREHGQSALATKYGIDEKTVQTLCRDPS